METNLVVSLVEAFGPTTTILLIVVVMLIREKRNNKGHNPGDVSVIITRMERLHDSAKKNTDDQHDRVRHAIGNLSHAMGNIALFTERQKDQTDLLEEIRNLSRDHCKDAKRAAIILILAKLDGSHWGKEDEDIEAMTVAQLKDYAASMEWEGPYPKKKKDLLAAIRERLEGNGKDK